MPSPADTPSAIRRAASRPVAAAGGFAQGFSYSLMGFRLAFSKGFKRWSLAPVVFSVVLYVGGLGSFVYWIRALFDKWFGDLDRWYEWLAAVGIGLGLMVAFALIFFFTFVVLVALLAAPFLDILSAKTEAKLTGTAADESFTFKRFVVDVLRGLSHAVKIVFLQILVLIVALIPFVGPPVAIVGTAFLLTLEYMDPAMARHRLRFRDKRRVVLGSPMTCMGFGLGAMLWLIVPGVNLVCIPAAVCGATALWLTLEQ